MRKLGGLGDEEKKREMVERLSSRTAKCQATYQDPARIKDDPSNADIERKRWIPVIKAKGHNL